jgi:hypothetical protein
MINVSVIFPLLDSLLHQRTKVVLCRQQIDAHPRIDPQLLMSHLSLGIRTGILRQDFLSQVDI